MRTVVEFEGVAFSFGGPAVLEDVSLEIAEREFVCIVGPNGGGKTTLLKLMLGLIRPTRGRVRVFGDSPQRARRRIGYMPQHARFDPLFPVTVLDVVLMGRLGDAGARMFGAYSRRDRRAARRALAQLDIEPLGKRPLASLSGGELRRVLIARALAGEPELLLLDEPTANLDLHVEGRFYELLSELNQRLTIVLVSHDVGFVSKLVRRVVCVNRNAVTHAVGEITTESISEMYGHDMRLVRHDHCDGE